jgi:hypothetical protein
MLFISAADEVNDERERLLLGECRSLALSTFCSLGVLGWGRPGQNVRKVLIWTRAQIFLQAAFTSAAVGLNPSFTGVLTKWQLLSSGWRIWKDLLAGMLPRFAQLSSGRTSAKG